MPGFDDDPFARPSSAMLVDIEGFEGPLDLLLMLARSQKLDLAKISILALADQYLEFVEDIRSERLELAADYLVMAAWLAYLKSRLLLPVPELDDEMDGEEMAARLAFRLQRLEAMRDAAARLMGRNRLGHDVFARGNPEPVHITRTQRHDDKLYDLLKAYGERRQIAANVPVRFERLPVWTLSEARERLEHLMGSMTDWGRLDDFLLDYLAEPEMRDTVLASSFSASLELVREGELELRQAKPFEPLYMRRRPSRPRAA